MVRVVVVLRVDSVGSFVLCVLFFVCLWWLSCCVDGTNNAIFCFLIFCCVVCSLLCVLCSDLDNLRAAVANLAAVPSSPTTATTTTTTTESKDSKDSKDAKETKTAEKKEREKVSERERAARIQTVTDALLIDVLTRKAIRVLAPLLREAFLKAGVRFCVDVP